MSMWNNDRRLFISACLALLVAVSLGTMAWRASAQAEKAAEWVEHTYLVLSNLEASQRTHHRMTAQFRGYLLTDGREKGYLTRRDSAWGEWQGIHHRLRGLTADNPVQQERLAEVQMLFDGQLTEQHAVTDAYQHGVRGDAPLSAELDNQAGDKLDGKLQEMRRHEEQLLEARKIQELDRSLHTRIVVIALLAILTAFPLYALWRLRREYVLRQGVEMERATLSDIIEATPDILLISGLDGRVRYLNPAACQKLGRIALKPGESFHVSEVNPAWSFEKAQTEAIPTALESGSWTGEGAFLSPVGREIPVSQVVIAHRSPQGVTISTIARDISKAKHSEQVLAEAAKFDQTQGQVLAIFNASFDRKEILQGTLDTLAENHPFPVSAAYIYDEWNGSLRCEAARGAPGSLAKEFRLGEGLIGQAAMDNKGILVDKLDAEGSLVIETGVLTIEPKAVLISPIIYQERRQGMLVIASTRPIFERERSLVDRLAGQLGVALHNLKLFAEMKLLSDQLRARGEEINVKNRQLEEADRLKSEFLANMSHELRTPLNSIIGFSEVLVDGLRGDLTSGQKEYVEQILDSGRHLLSLINDILDLSKVEAGRMDLDLKPLDIPTILHDSLSIILEKAAAHRVDLRCEAAPELGVLHADGRKVKQILFNLLSNAVKFTPEGGSVRLEAEQVDRVQADRLLPNGRRTPLPDSDHAQFIEIRVMDTGIGIPRKGLTRLFEPFIQLESSLQRTHEGTGLGLVMVRKMAELHGGGVGVQSEDGQGSTFFVWLPYGLDQPPPALLVEAPMEAPDLSHSPTPLGLVRINGPAPKVLVVDDDPKALEILSTLLQSRGFSVERAYGGREAIDIIRQETFDLVLLDLLMPEVSGFDVVEALKTRPDTAAVPILALTAKHLTNADRAQLDGLVDTIMVKSEFNPETFIAAVHRVLLLRQSGKA